MKSLRDASTNEKLPGIITLNASGEYIEENKDFIHFPLIFFISKASVLIYFI